MYHNERKSAACGIYFSICQVLSPRHLAHFILKQTKNNLNLNKNIKKDPEHLRSTHQSYSTYLQHHQDHYDHHFLNNQRIYGKPLGTQS